MNGGPYLYKSTPYDPDVICITGGESGRMLGRGFQRMRLKMAYFFNPYDSGKRTGEHREPKTPVIKDPTDPAYYHDVAAVGDGRRLFGVYIQDPLIAAAWERDQQGGPAGGLSLGNIFMDFSAREANGDLAAACQRISEFIGSPPILPISSSFAHLQGEWANSGDKFFREHEIDNPGANRANRIARVWLDRDVTLNPDFERMLLTGKRKVLAFGPGSLYGSTLGATLTKDLPKIVDLANPWIIYICNLATVPGETVGMSIRDHIDEMNAYLGKHKVDEVFVNAGQVSTAVRRQYRRKGQAFLKIRPHEFDGLNCVVNCDNYLASNPIVPTDVSNLEEARNVARHDSKKIAAKVDDRVEMLRQQGE